MCPCVSPRVDAEARTLMQIVYVRSDSGKQMGRSGEMGDLVGRKAIKYASIGTTIHNVIFPGVARETGAFI